MPFGTIEDEVAQTRESLKPVVPGPKPPLSSKLLTPFRHLDDVISAVTNSTGFGKGTGLEPKEDESNALEKSNGIPGKTMYWIGIRTPVDCVPSMLLAANAKKSNVTA